MSLSRSFSTCAGQGAHNALAFDDETTADWRLTDPGLSGAGFLGPADEFPPIGCSLVHGIASLPRPIGQASGEGLMTAQAARSQDMADIVGKTTYLGFDQSGDPPYQLVEPLSPLGILKQINTDPQRVFGIVNVGQKRLGDQNAVVFESDAQRRSFVVQSVQHHRDGDGI